MKSKFRTKPIVSYNSINQQAFDVVGNLHPISLLEEAVWIWGELFLATWKSRAPWSNGTDSTKIWMQNICQHAFHVHKAGQWRGLVPKGATMCDIGTTSS